MNFVTEPTQSASERPRAARMIRYARRRLLRVVIGMILLCLPACRIETERHAKDQPKLEPYEASDFFADGAADRPAPAGTVPYQAPDEAARTKQPETTLALVRRGRERFDIHCAPCHGRDGYGEGMVIQRGFPAAASYHEPRLRNAPDRHVYNVITSGRNKMPAFGDTIAPRDRWAIVAYVRALQLSQHAAAAELPEGLREELNRDKKP